MIHEFEGKTEKEAIELAAAELGLEKDQFDVEIIETQKTGLFKKGHVRICVHTDNDVMPKKAESNESEFDNSMPKGKPLFQDPLPRDDFEKALVDFVASVIRKMGYDVNVEIMFREERKIGLRLDSNSSSILIGRKGKNLDSLQLLANVFAGRQGREDVRVILDTENYRIRREESLVRLAYTTADRVRISKNSILLEPMNPFERRLIHTTLNDIADVETKSEGEGLYKQVRVLFKGR
ncbi:protein jag [Brucepastera parasyntrophica]|uniref:RNA-binding cell elongation regulator Jag/EloR n=1 Tax=Brucepastera parasyntrophica TaxID=2880008 RepID=UPI00210BC23B|nr:RNA-binding cell elongation regulator Jag/EloR [Brucepastera parasyntrophica]ULQ58611.1 protein jag [Brucepastera parasyntrophica]